MATKKLSAKAFFADIKEQPDATRVAKATPKAKAEDNSLTQPYNGLAETFTNGEYRRRREQGKREDMMDIQSAARYGNAYEGRDNMTWEQKDSADVEDGRRIWNSGKSAYGRRILNDIERKQMNTDEYADQVEKQSKHYRNDAGAENNRRQAENYKKLRKAANEKKAEAFERNLHRFDAMDTKKNPSGWAKEFFRDLHDKK